MRQLRNTALAAGILAVFTTSACTNDTPDDVVEVAPACTSTSNVVLSLTAGTTPKFTWTPNCTVTTLYVQRVSDLGNMWTLSSQTAPLKSGITYGTVPELATASVAQPLAVGVQYKAELKSSQGATFASKTFTP